jgi:GxxExxY protein
MRQPRPARGRQRRVEQGGEERRRLWGLSEDVIGALIEVHRHLGPGLLESTYESCVCRELTLRRLAFERQCPLPVTYKGMPLDCGYRLDLVVEGCILIELKSVEAIRPVHIAQVVTYLKLSALPVGLLTNFNVPILRQGLRRLCLSSPPPLPVILSVRLTDSPH